MSAIAELIGAAVGMWPKLDWTCPCCGHRHVKSRIAKPLGPFVKDGPTVAEMSCPKCGYKWSMPLRVGP